MFITIAVVCFCVLVFASSTTFETKTNSYYGKESVINKLVVTVAPEANDPNSVSSTATSTDSYFCTLKRISIAADGCDLDFNVILKDENGLAVFSKTDCNTALLPLSYALVTSDVGGVEYLGVPVAGTLMVDTNDVDPNNLTSVTVSIYYDDYRK